MTKEPLVEAERAYLIWVAKADRKGATLRNARWPR